MIYTALNDFYLDASHLNASPSRQDGVTADLESQLRRYGCDAIAEAVVLLRLPQAVACTAQVLLHRFYCKRSLIKFDIKVVAIAAFWLGAKLEEVIEIDSPNKLRLRDVLTVFYRVFRRRDGKFLDLLDPFSQRYDALKTEAVRAERHMLRAFGFVVHVEHPHRFVLTFGQLLGLSKEVLQEGWNLANDSLRTTLCVQHKAEIVACGLLFLAARRQGVPMPENPPWWEVFGVSKEQLLEVASAIIELLGQPKASYVALGKDFTSRGVNGAASPPVPASPQPISAAPSSGAAEPVREGEGPEVRATTAMAGISEGRAPNGQVLQTTASKGAAAQAEIGSEIEAEIPAADGAEKGVEVDNATVNKAVVVAGTEREIGTADIEETPREIDGGDDLR